MVNSCFIVSSLERNEMKKSERKAMKIREAQERLERWRSLTPAQRLAELDKRPGNSTRQRARILKEMN